ncbi:hypothetical protein TspCOW1_00710 [Thiohalobacter sp. COW1]|uniref:hypothetical protein n=1 Tax=Thiohalobacter sp. COW1 TaxID=2795687 RepID=UPI0019152AC3|nr:hypothetical protein [Thiohalobacter sp. COW1]BCO29968.1 hypothetical protein TspCOW1_00710 [Thiohalobacter sp. COW1]
MSIGLFFVIFFALLLGAVVWILRHPNSRPLTGEEWSDYHERRRKDEDDYWFFFRPGRDD